METKFIKTVFLSFCMVWLVSCNNDDLQEPAGNNSSELVIETGLRPMDKSLKSGPVSDFTEGSKLGLFITRGSLNDDYSSSASRNILSTFTGGIWKQNPAVNLYAHDATVFAYYPYSSSYTNGAEIPVQSGSTDYMYGTHTTGQAAVNKDNRTVSLTMNHALALVQFNIYKANYPWQGRLDRVCINNAPGKAIVHYDGNLDIQTGEISDMSGTDRNIQVNSSPLLMIPDEKSTDENGYVKLLLVPTAKTSSRGEVVITFDIDGRAFTWEAPAGTEWKQGTRNTYDVQLNGNELRIGQVKIAGWTDGTGGNAFPE
ncbi:fimbrillin family protein [Dysgonomonas macrotermitis]|uniref:Fimbrillin-like n=1 Tax=Dysgonomonas macrotermitis TaxID=1346286 RepID=A0A1M5JN05_9BACT|nr:fimbrillin family protein [Dysgonomonas macrotermitis]SHG41640.1 Fimbrillin-like [Dysgonomonas macrotermitis]